MSIQEKINILKALAAVDATILGLSKTLDEEESGIEEKSQRHVSLAARVEQMEQQVDAMDHTRGELVGELRQNSFQVEKSREKMNRCRNEREANAVQRELEELRRLSRDREIEIQKLVGIIDEARGELEKLTAERDEILGQIDETEGAATTKVREVSAELAEKQKLREEQLAKLDGLTKRRYETVRQRRGSGVCPTVKGSCAACHISLPPMLYQRIMLGQELLDCPQCRRILFFGAEASAEGDAAGSAAAPAKEAAPSADSSAEEQSES